MNNITELLKFSKDYKLQYKGVCSIFIDTTKLSLIIQQNGEEDLMAPFSRNFIFSKEMLCALGPKKTNDIALFFSKEGTCKKVYDCIIDQKVKNTSYKPLGENDIKQLFNERFISPLFDAFKDSTNLRFKEIVTSTINVLVGNSEEENVDYLTDSSLTFDNVESTNDNAIPRTNVKTEVSLPSEPINMAPIDLSFQQGNEASSIAFSEYQTSYLDHSETSNYENGDESDVEHQAKKRRCSVKDTCKTKWLQPDEFEVINAIQRKLMVFTSSDKQFCFEFSWHLNTETFYCRGCKKLGISIKAKILKHLNGNLYAEVSDISHKCKVVLYKPFNPLEKIRNNDKFELVKKLKNGKTCSMLIMFEENDKQMCRK
uniref:Uncharacterized protein n=1 Tax=Panagrolaimus superbus TaxID=310955 RepID=A0A914XUN4_9BILA